MSKHKSAPRRVPSRGGRPTGQPGNVGQPRGQSNGANVTHTMNGANGASPQQETTQETTAASTASTASTPKARPAGSPPQRPASSGAARTSGRIAPASGATGKPRVISRPSARRARAVPWWRRGNVLVYATVAVVGALVILFIALGQRSGSDNTAGSENTPTSASVAKALSQVSPSVFAQVKTGSATNTLKATHGATPLVTADGKAQVVYIGADYCPFCAAERWSLIVSLSRFGTFANLHDTTSSSNDVYANTPTFSFYGSSYTSQYVEFTPVETTTRDPNTPLQTPTAEQEKLLATYDAPPYTDAQSAGAIPFVDIGGTYVLSGAGYSPQVLQGLTRDQIAAKLSNPSDPVTQAIVGHANYLTAAICVATQNKPAEVCSESTIQAIEQQLPKGS